MNVYNEAHNLAKAIKECEEFKIYGELKAKINENEELAHIISDLQNVQMQLQFKQISGEEPEAELLANVQELYGIVMKDPLTAEYMQAEMRCSMMMNDVYKIIGEAMGVVAPAEEQ